MSESTHFSTLNKSVVQINKKAFIVFFIALALIGSALFYFFNTGALGGVSKGNAAFVETIAEYDIPKYNVYKNKTRSDELIGNNIAIHGTVTEVALSPVENNRWCYLTVSTEDGDWCVNINALSSTEILDTYLNREFFVYGQFAYINISGLPSLTFETAEQGLYETSNDAFFANSDFEIPDEILYSKTIELEENQLINISVSQDSQGNLQGFAAVALDGTDLYREGALALTITSIFMSNDIDSYAIGLLSSKTEPGLIIVADGETKALGTTLSTDHITVFSEDTSTLISTYLEDCLYLVESVSDYADMSKIYEGLSELGA